ncbi:conserved Plasmodium protein, unknown function [Plasmodium ovale curtisi]|uniref:Uncharacterized protein n=1 Tax=Plasmodium ovale curtisi TaxID=864141 RepID=A0A1A8WVT6_PLAOA|nr:conserved Plasmodium protein, unknown function [Plasmodium ovale curtisi]
MKKGKHKNKKLATTILERAKNILLERKRLINGENKKFPSNVENSENVKGESEGEKTMCVSIEQKDISAENESKNFFNLQDFSFKYSKTCEIRNLDYENAEYELLISFMNTFNNELTFQLKLSRNDEQEGKENCVLHKMVKIFIDKLTLCCTNPILFLPKNSGDQSTASNADNDGLFVKKKIIFSLEQIEQNSDADILFEMCFCEISDKIFHFKPDPNDMTSWISRQAFVELIKIIIGQSIKRYEQCNNIEKKRWGARIIYITDLIKKNHSSLSFFQVDNVVVLVEIKYSSFEDDTWFAHFADLVHSLRSSDWKIFLNQLIVIETFLYNVKREKTKKAFNELHKQLELAASKNSTYSKWFKIQLPLSMSLFK